MSEEAAERAAALAEAESWTKTPYHHQGDIKGVGVDCAMLLVRVYHAVGMIPAIDPRPYPHDWHLHRDQERYLGWVEQFGRQVGFPHPGDIALYRFGRVYSHGAIVVKWPDIIHAYVGRLVQHDHGDQDWLLKFRKEKREVLFYSLWPRKWHPAAEA